MAEIAKSGTPSLGSVLPPQNQQIAGLKAGEALAAGDACRINAADGLVYRYLRGQALDGLEGDGGTFNLCSFWLVEALTRSGRTDPARLADAPALRGGRIGEWGLMLCGERSRSAASARAAGPCGQHRPRPAHAGP